MHSYLPLPGNPSLDKPVHISQSASPIISNYDASHRGHDYELVYPARISSYGTNYSHHHRSHITEGQLISACNLCDAIDHYLEYFVLTTFL